MTWDQNTIEVVPEPSPRGQHVDLDTLDDGRCKASSWRVKRAAKPDYEGHFGPGGYNRCIGDEGHTNPLHKDEWGNVFRVDPDGTHFRVVRTEPRQA